MKVGGVFGVLVVLVRFAELLMSSIAVSAFTRGTMAMQVVNSTNQGIGIAFFLGMMVFIAMQVFLLRRSFFEVRNLREYIIYNLIAYFIFAVLSMAVRVYLGNVFHTWTFGIYKFMMFANADMTWWQSAIYGHIVMFAVILLAPIGLRRYDDEFDEDDTFILDDIDPEDIEYGEDEAVTPAMDSGDEEDDDDDYDALSDEDFDWI